MDSSYDFEAFLAAVLPLGPDRCPVCYRMRLDRTFRRAAEEGADAVCATLLYSRYQRHEAIAAAAEELSAKYGVPFLYKDFREGWKEGQESARRLNIYRQSYCGCIFSEHERFAAKGQAKAPVSRG